MSILKCLPPGADLLCGLLAYPNAASAQSYGEIRGTVTDVSGAVVNGAAITVKGVANNQVRRAVTNLLLSVPGNQNRRDDGAHVVISKFLSPRLSAAPLSCRGF